MYKIISDTPEERTNELKNIMLELIELQKSTSNLLNAYTTTKQQVNFIYFLLLLLPCRGFPCVWSRGFRG